MAKKKLINVRKRAVKSVKKVSVVKKPMENKEVKVCKDCGAENAPRYAYCEKCGGMLETRLRVVCPQCAALNRTDALSCRACGMEFVVSKKKAIRAVGVKKISKKTGESPSVIVETVQASQEQVSAPVVIKPELDASQIISEAFNVYVDNFPVFILIGIISGFVAWLRFFSGITAEQSGIYVLFSIIDYGFSVLAILMIYIALKMNDDGVKPSFNRFWEILNRALARYFDYLITVILYALMVVGGLLLLIVPGIIFSYQYIFAGIISAVDWQSGGKYFSRSKAVTEGYKINIFFTVFIYGLAMLPAFLLCMMVAYLACLYFRLPVDKEFISNINIIFAPLFFPYATSALYMIYRKLRKIALVV